MAFMLIAVSTLALMDGCLKALSGHYGALQVATIRSISAMPFVLGWVALTIGFRPLLNVRFPLHLLRGAIGIMMLTFFTWALRRLALVEAYSIFFVAPILITTFAALILREKVDARRWLAIGIGFTTVLVMLRPTGEGAMTLAGLAVLISAFGYALSAITVRVLHRTDSSQSMVFWVMTLQGLGAAALSFADWQPILRSDWLVWRTTPALSTLIGSAVLIVSGVYLLRRESVHVEAEHP